MNFTTLFGTIHESHYTILTNIYLYLQYFQQKNFNFSKINGPQTDLESNNYTNDHAIDSSSREDEG